jgi:hypothetical protein
MRVTLQYFEGCPNWKYTEAHIEALEAEGFDLIFERQLIESLEKAEEVGFRGSPTVLIDGIDPFADPDAPVGLACRVYKTDGGYAGSPSLTQLRTALQKAS